MSARILPANEESIALAAAILRRGGLVAFPTETVYGLGADAANDTAVAAIFSVKQRPGFNPLIIHVRDLAHAHSLAAFNAKALSLAEVLWPGPLTLVLPRKPAAQVSLLASAGLDTIGLRVPADSIARRLLETSRLAIAAPSANRSGKVSSTRADHVAQSLGEGVELILDGGAASLGIESTIVGFDGLRPALLRPGALPRKRIEDLIGRIDEPAGDQILSPGRLRMHYAPRTRLRLEATTLEAGEALLAFGSTGPLAARATRNLSPSENLSEAAANLFCMLRELDAMTCPCIAVMPVPMHGLGEAINDRLRRAAERDD